MKYLCLVIVLVFGLWVGSCAADDAQKTTAAKTVVTEENPDSKMKEIDTGNGGGNPIKEGYGVDQQRTMPAGQTYDENTGLPNTVESDKAGELE